MDTITTSTFPLRRLCFGAGRALALILALWASDALAQASDSDLDGVPDAEDLCAGTPAGRAPILFGCLPVDAVPYLERALDYSMRGLESSTAVMRRVDGLEADAARIDRLSETFYTKTRDFVGQGRFCKASTLAGRFSGRLAKSGERVDATIAALARQASRSPLVVPDGNEADASTADRQALDMRIARNGVIRAIDDVSTNLERIDAFCTRIVRDLHQTGRVLRIDDDARRLELASGLVVMLGSRAHRHPIYEGADIELSGTSWDDGTGVATTVLPAAQVPKPGLLPIECMGLRILPVQPFPPYYSGPFTMHNPEAYRPPNYIDNSLELDQGMAIAVVNASGCEIPDAPPGTATRVSVQVDRLRYGHPDDVLAADLTEADGPLRLPGWGFMSGMRLTIRRQSCRPVLLGQPPDCDPPVDIHVVEHELRYGQTTRPCEDTVFNATGYSVDDADPDSYDVAHVADYEAEYEILGPDEVLGGGTSNLAFTAEGYKIVGGVPSWPMVLEVGLGDEFAVYGLEREFYDLYGPFPFLSKEATGTDKPSALRWPRLTGERNGHTFWYRCPLPVISRDLISRCGGVADTYYRFPYEGGSPDWALGQANNGSFTHQGAFAFDFGAAAETPILAARGGVVSGVRSSSTGSCFCPKPTCNPAKCQNCVSPNNGNFVAILHDDGTVARYLHFLPDTGVAVSEGQRVRRGDLLGLVGSTGCSTGPHLHFEVGAAPGQPTIEITFEADVPGSEVCYLPDQGDPVDSTNIQNP